MLRGRRERVHPHGLCSDKTLADVVKRRGPLSLPVAAARLREIVPAVASLHRTRCVHRDLKLGNVFLTAAGADELPPQTRRGRRRRVVRRERRVRFRVLPRAPEGRSGISCRRSRMRTPSWTRWKQPADAEQAELACRLAAGGARRPAARRIASRRRCSPQQRRGHSYEVDVWSIVDPVADPPGRDAPVPDVGRARDGTEKSEPARTSSPAGKRRRRRGTAGHRSAEATREGVKKQGSGPHRAPRVRAGRRRRRRSACGA